MDKQLLVDKDNMKVYVTLGYTWTDPVLFMEHQGKLKAFTASSGELEYLLGEFMMYESRLSDEELELALEIIDEIADPDTIETEECISRKSFSLNKEYMLKIKELDENTPPII